MLKYMEALNRLTLLEEKMKEHKDRNH